MKPTSYLLALPIAAAMSVVSCKKPAPAPVTTATSGAPAADAAPDASPDVAPAVSVKPSERASKLGFAQMLPKDTETLLLVQNGADLLKRFQGSKFYGFIKSQNPEVDQIIEGDDSGELKPLDILGLELFLATGKSTGEQTTNLLQGYDRQSYYQVRNTLAMVISSMKGEEPDFSMLGQGMTDLIKDPESGVALLKKSEMPPVYLGCKTTPENREKVLEAFNQLTSNLAAAGTAVEEVKFEVDGKTFSGNQIVGKKLVEDFQADTSMMEMLEESVEKETLDELMKTLAEKNLLAVTGVVNDYVVLFVGSRKEDLKFAPSPTESFAASDALAFVDPYLEKNPAVVAYGNKAVIDGLMSGDGIATIAQALRDAIAGNGKVDTREIESMLDVISEREKDLRALTQCSTLGVVAMIDDGFKIETFGGTNSPNIQTQAQNRLGELGASKDTAIFVNWTGNPVYGIKANAYVESLIETAYAITRNVSTWEVEENEAFAAFQQYFTMFEENFSDDMVKLWQAMSIDMSDGLGNESALVVDLKGEMPPLPNVPQELVKAGKFPRVSLVKPVKDRAKLASAWEKINTSGESIMKQISTMTGNEQAMPQPMSSKENGLVTWFFSGVPLLTDDFSPSVTLDDKWFVASTSKKHAVELAQKAESSSSGKTGAYMIVKFDALRACAEHWVKAVDENKEAVFEGNESAADDFTANQKMINDSLKAMSELDEMTLHVRKESGQERSTFHLKTR
jgi:hypothetical protein